MSGADAARSTPAAERNRGPILEVLRRVMPAAPEEGATGRVLEIAAGAGQHAVHFASAFPAFEWLPSDPDPGARASIDAWRERAALTNLRPALDLDVCREPWPVDAVDAVVCINMIHISPPGVTRALIDGAARRLPPGGVLFLYGPYRRGGAHTAPSNAEFDASLKARDPRWGVRDLEWVAELAAAAAFGVPRVFDMPANNLSVVFRRG